MEEEKPILDAEEKKCNVEQDGSLSDSDASDKTIDDANENIYIGRDKTTVWRRVPYASKLACIGKGNNVKCRETNCHRYSDKKHKIADEVSTFFEIIDDGILEEIVACTNLLIEHKRQSRVYSRERDVKETTRAELLALIGLLYLIGVKRANHTNLLELWTDDGTGLEICRSTMSYRYSFIKIDPALSFLKARSKY